MFEDILDEKEIITVVNMKEYYCNKCDFTIVRSGQSPFIQCDECGAWLQATIRKYPEMSAYPATISC